MKDGQFFVMFYMSKPGFKIEDLMQFKPTNVSK